MLRILFLALMLCLLAPIVSAQTTELPKEKRFFTMQSCDDPRKMAGLIMRKYKEEPLFRGQGMQFNINGQMYWSDMMYFVNQETGSWSLVALFKDGIACLVANGRAFEPYNGPLLLEEKL
tara:strand:+ start:857 stop:1216 length:360 start_codon:yes stop_codon:yes gene_type:complete